MMTPREVAEETGYHPLHINYLIRNRKLKARKKPTPGGKFVYDISSAEVSRLKKKGKDNRGRKADA